MINQALTEFIASMQWSNDTPRALKDLVELNLAGFAILVEKRLAETKNDVSSENTRLRAALAVSKDPCIYCQLPKEEMAKCKSGFPGCGRMDDMTGCPEFGAMLDLQQTKEEMAELQADKARLEWLLQQPAYIAYAKDGDDCWVHWAYDPDDEEAPSFNQAGNFNTPREAIDAAMKERPNP